MKKMKLRILLATIFLFRGFTYAQTINVTLTEPAIPFQDADMGAMGFGDIDNDGDQDLIITGKGGPIKTTLYTNDGAGNFTAASGSSFTNVFDGSVGFADINNDGFIDLLITGSTGVPNRTANLYINNGNGTFSIAATPFTPSYGGDFDFADIDNDGDQDLILTGLDASDVPFTTLYRNLGNTNFTADTSTPFEQVGLSTVSFLDAENDGDMDVILAGTDKSNRKSTTLYLNNGNGMFTLNNTNSFTGISLGEIAIADADNNGYMDILITGLSAAGSVTKLYSNNGNGLFKEITGTPFTGTSASALEFADFDNDGFMDILLLGAGNFNGVSALAHIYKNQGSNNFVFSNELIATYFASAAIADIDGDNDLDFIIGGTHFTQPTRNPKMYVNNLKSPLNIQDQNKMVLSFYPNPTEDNVFVLANRPIVQFTVFNSFGRIAMTKKVYTDCFNIDLSSLSNGLYFVRLDTYQNSQTIKLHKH